VLKYWGAVLLVPIHVAVLAVVPQGQLASGSVVHAVDVGVPLGERGCAFDVNSVAGDPGVYRPAVGIEVALDQARGGGLRTGDPGLEVARVAVVEVAVHGGDLHLVADARLLALEAIFDLAVGRATVAVDVVAVIAVFVEHDTVATTGSAAGAAALRFVGAVGRAAIEGQGVAVVAALGALDVLVAAGGVRASAGTTVALPTDLDPATVRAAVAGGLVAVVALLGKDHQSIATASHGVASFARGGARKPGFDTEAVVGATVAGHGVAVVAGLVLGQHAIAAIGARRCIGAHAVRGAGVEVDVRRGVELDDRRVTVRAARTLGT
jgi:hypothetical protein